jgi:hypothetical protein
VPERLVKTFMGSENSVDFFTTEYILQTSLANNAAFDLCDSSDGVARQDMNI